MTSGARTRAAAADLLLEVLERRRTLDDALGSVESFGKLTGSDRGFARAMASAVLRELGRIDTGLIPFLERPIDTALPGARALLRLGAAQLWLMETPPHAAVTETVAAAALVEGTGRATGFLNAVLRKASEDRSAFDTAPATAIWPDWLRGTFIDSLGREATEQLASAARTIPAVDLATRPGEAAEWADTLGGIAIDDETLTLPDGAGAIESLPGYAEGKWWVQDRAAQLPVRLLGDVSGARVLDLCAAPGGKTLQLAARGAEVVAVDRSAPRLRRLKANAKRTGLDDLIQIVTAEVESWAPDASADFILLDAPCSAMGTLRRHPEGAWIKAPVDIARFPDVQTRLLRAAAEWLSPGGVLVYCVCSPIRAEGEAVVDTVVSDGGLERVPVSADELRGRTEWITARGDALTLPMPDHDGGLNDAFYIARLRRT